MMSKGKMDLTPEQQELLTILARRHHEKRGTFTLFLGSVIRLIYHVKPAGLTIELPYAIDVSDFEHLASEELITLNTNKTSNALHPYFGEVTMKGLAVAEDIDTARPPRGRLPSSVNKPVTAPDNVVFIGHGRSTDWLQLDRYLHHTLKLRTTEFNSVSTAVIDERASGGNAQAGKICLSSDDGRR